MSPHGARWARCAATVVRQQSLPIGDAAGQLTAAHLVALLLGVNQFAVYVALPKPAELPTGNTGFGLSVRVPHSCWYPEHC